MKRPLPLAASTFALGLLGACSPPPAAPSASPHASPDTTAPVAPAVAPSVAECAPVLVDPWVRAAPPGTMMLAGYATFDNPCAAPVVIVGAESMDFGSASVHATLEEGGMSRMRPTGPVTVAAHGQATFAPGGMHLMLMEPAREFAEGDKARIRFVLADGRHVFAEFAVRRDPSH